MPARHRLGGDDIGGIALPDFAGRWLGVAPDAAGCAPQDQRRAINFAAGVEILVVMDEVDAGAGAVVLADGVDGLGVSEAALVFGERLGGKNDSPCWVFANFFSMNQSGSAPIIFSGSGAGWMLKNQCQENLAQSNVMLRYR